MHALRARGLWPASTSSALAGAAPPLVCKGDVSASGALSVQNACGPANTVAPPTPPTDTLKGVFPVTVTGRQKALIVACSASAGGVSATALQVSAAFVNPYGYLPGQVFGLLPFWGILFVLYLALALVYAVAALCARKHLILLQVRRCRRAPLCCVRARWPRAYTAPRPRARAPPLSSPPRRPLSLAPS
jgi:hypothetical protein